MPGTVTSVCRPVEKFIHCHGVRQTTLLSVSIATSRYLMVGTLVIGTGGYNVYDRLISMDLHVHVCGQRRRLESLPQTRMWANAQRDGRPAEHRWRPLFNAAKFG